MNGLGCRIANGHYHLHVFPRYQDDGFGWQEPKKRSDRALEQVRHSLILAMQKNEE